ncbi:MAG: hypothetical protein SGI88_10630 [Candidatus Hydrogenedentes bacterium]|nr:hypothetical protein [Candidatus Hydrogenedentota bacterium]
MKKNSPKVRGQKKDDLLSNYDFSGGVRGKHHRKYRVGHALSVKKQDGSVSTRFFTLKDGAVMLDPFVREHFPDSKSVNKHLRALIPIVPKKRKPTPRTK